MTEERKKELEEMIDEFFEEDDEETGEEEEKTPEKHFEHQNSIEFLNTEELLNFEDDTPQKITFKDIQDKKLRDLNKDEKKVALGHFLIITVFLFLNAFVITQFVNIDTNDKVVDIETTTNTKVEQKTEGDSEYTRYITKENLENLDENSEWKKDKKMNEELQEAIDNQDKLDEIEGYELEGELE